MKPGSAILTACTPIFMPDSFAIGAAAKAALAMLLWGAAAIGYVMTKLTWWERALAAVAAAFLVLALPLTDEIGFALSALAIGIHVFRARGRTPTGRTA